MARELGDHYKIIEEGLNGRTTRWDDPLEPGRNGLTYLAPCLESHHPLDMVLIMLGTNDLKQRFRLSASDIAESAGGLAAIAKQAAQNAAGESPQVLLIAPPAVTILTDLDEMFAGAEPKSRLFSRYYRLAAGWNGASFFDAGSVIESSPLDGIHFEAKAHRILGEALANEVRRAFA
jgi:lysophospholipase L1-like esterase